MAKKKPTSASNVKQFAPAVERRMRGHRNLPDPNGDTTQRWSKDMPELKDVTEAQMVMLLMESDAFQQTVQPLLDRAEEERFRRQRRKRRFLYRVEEIERVILFKAITGTATMVETRDKLGGDRTEARRTLGFDFPRNEGRPGERETLDGVPSEATLCRQRQLFDPKERAEAYVALFKMLRDQHIIDFPDEMLEELLRLGIDGSKIEITGECPIWEKKKKGDKGKRKKRLVNASRITCPDGGYVAKGASPDKTGHGFNKMTIGTATKLPVVFDVTPLNRNEGQAASELIAQYREDVLPLLPERRLGVLTGDSAFAANSLRKEIRSVGLIENAHNVSHADKPSVRKRAASKRKERTKIEGYEDWFVDGLQQVICRCGKTATGHWELDRKGEVACRVYGSCEKCGSVSITSGRYRLSQNPKKYLKVDPKNKDETPDYRLGNGLTYDSKMSAAYGSERWSRGEGLNSVMASRFGLTTGKRRYKTIQDARADVAASYALMHLLTMMQRKLEAAGAAPPLAA
ncbi:MAG TPA: hypothetical protein VJ838_01660 [Gaiellaceae bacterium]|nr:hypothetical protein [Gaiellaceae bacterium]